MTVSYSSVHKWDGGFQGKLTIVNHGTATVSGWMIAITLPGDQVLLVREAAGHTDGDVLRLEPTPSDPPLRPGGALSVYFVARGPATSPSACTYDGAKRG